MTDDAAPEIPTELIAVIRRSYTTNTSDEDAAWIDDPGLNTDERFMPRLPSRTPPPPQGTRRTRRRRTGPAYMA